VAGPIWKFIVVEFSPAERTPVKGLECIAKKDHREQAPSQVGAQARLGGIFVTGGGGLSQHHKFMWCEE